MGKAKKQRASHRKARARADPIGYADVSDDAAGGADAALSKRYDGVRGHERAAVPSGTRDSGSRSAPRAQLNSLDHGTREAACGAVASLFVATGEHGSEAERQRLYDARARMVVRSGVAAKVVMCMTDPSPHVREHAAGAIRCASLAPPCDAAP